MRYPKQLLLDLAVLYQVQFVTAEYYSEILATPQEQCGIQP